ncbi:class I adenylate-forming enzyme family protein [Gordonia sp. NPDC058843]|uniref:class I adenylate-forming enzyme family protein n=1 Tax=Gordonia sp. NPDC058843 TaxID=3346648 RepID=UPI0036B1F7B3
MSASESTDLGLPTGPTWGSVLAIQAHRLPDVLALSDDHGVELDYRTLDEEVRRAAWYWRSLGVGPGDRVALLGRNSVELVVNLLGLGLTGAVPVLLNWRLADAELAELGRLCSPAIIAHDAEFRSGALAAVPDGQRIVMLGDATATTADGRRDVEPDHLDPVSGDTLALLHTSGTTGLPKVIALDEKAHIWGCGRLVTMAGLTERAVHLRFTPLFHLAGLQEIGASLLSGGTTLLQSDFDADVWLDTAAARGVAYGHLPPSTMRRVLAAFERRTEKPDLSSLVEIWYGTAPAGDELVTAALDAFGCGLRQVYGMTEAQSPVSMLGADDHESGSGRIGTAGRVLPEWEVRLRDPSGEAVSNGQPGELEIRGRQLFSGYWAPDGGHGSGLDAEGWYRTGDVAVLDEEGYLTIVDRVKDMVISGGENVYPAEVERLLAAHPDVREIAVIGVPDATWGETVHAVVVPRAPEFDIEAFIRWSRHRIAGFKRPRSVELVDELPRNASGKILKRALRERNTTSTAVGN